MTDKNKGQFQKGKSGNPNGRTKGVRNKRMTNTQVLQYLGKRKQSYFDAIEQLARDSMQPYSKEFDDVTGEKKVVENKMFDPKLSFNCFKELIGVEIQADIFEYKKSKDPAVDFIDGDDCVVAFHANGDIRLGDFEFINSGGLPDAERLMLLPIPAANAVIIGSRTPDAEFGTA